MKFVRVALALASLAIPACRSGGDPACAGRTAADYAPNEVRYRAMTPAERREDAVRFNELARRCGWEP